MAVVFRSEEEIDAIAFTLSFRVAGSASPEDVEMFFVTFVMTRSVSAAGEGTVLDPSHKVKSSSRPKTKEFRAEGGTHLDGMNDEWRVPVQMTGSSDWPFLRVFRTLLSGARWENLVNVAGLENSIKPVDLMTVRQRFSATGFSESGT